MVTGRPLLAPEPYTVFLDESGDHSLAKVDPQYPLFGLAGVFMETNLHHDFALALSSWKTGVFGRDVCLHMREITRNYGPFEILSDAKRRTEFWSNLQAEVDKHTFMLVCAVIRKDSHIDQYGPMAHNPYYLTLEFIVERFCREMEERESRLGFVAESRNTQLDSALQSQYSALLATGTRFVSGKVLRKHLNPTIQFQRKQPGAMGLQVADLAIGPVCRYVGRMKAQQALRVRHRLRLSPNGHFYGWGLKVFP